MPNAINLLENKVPFPREKGSTSAVKKAYIALGSNIGPSKYYLSAGLKALNAPLSGLHLIQQSSLYTSPPLDGSSQPDYLNMVCLIQCQCCPKTLLQTLQSIEGLNGRPMQHRARWAPRTLDLDLLIYEDVVCQEPELILPHPGISFRSFVLKPLLEIAPDLMLPGSGTKLNSYLEKATPKGCRLLCQMPIEI